VGGGRGWEPGWGLKWDPGGGEQDEPPWEGSDGGLTQRGKEKSGKRGYIGGNMVGTKKSKKQYQAGGDLYRA